MPTVTSNGVEIPFDDDHFAPLADSTALLGSPAALRARYRADGYLLLRGVLDVDRLRALRRDYFSLFAPGYLQAGSDPSDGLFSGRRPAGLPAHGTTDHPAYRFVRSSQFLDFCADATLEGLAEIVIDEPVAQLPRRILRHFDRSAPVASRAHVDYTYLDGGTDDLVTAWIPIGDCPLAGGGLMYLQGSHHVDATALDRLRVRNDRQDSRPLSHDLAWVASQLGRRWLYTDFNAGDVALHSPHIVHASLDTTTEAMRLSCDLRFLPAGAQRDPRWLEAWAGDDGR